MNGVLQFLHAERARLRLEQFGVTGRLASVMLTPRFHASSHVVFLVLAEGRADPVLVAKVPRLGGHSPTLEREAANLRAVHARRPSGQPGAPRLVAFEPHNGWPILVETALVGRAFDRAAVRRDPARACAMGVDWLVGLAAPAPTAPAHPPAGASSAALAEGAGEWEHGALAAIARTREDSALIDRTLALTEPLSRAKQSAVFEHGDFSAPNVLRLRDGRIGAVDWELANPGGLPATDAFFWLTYVAFARSGARNVADQVAAFRTAFFGPRAWARPYVLDYADRIGIATECLTPLFVATWARYVSGLARRLAEAGAGWSAGRDTGTMSWLRQNRYFALWQCAVERFGELDWDAPAAPLATMPRLAGGQMARTAPVELEKA